MIFIAASRCKRISSCTFTMAEPAVNILEAINRVLSSCQRVQLHGNRVLMGVKAEGIEEGLFSLVDLCSHVDLLS